MVAPGSGLWKSTNGGATWTRLAANGLPDGEMAIGISIFRKDPRIVYVSIEQGFRYNASTAYTERRADLPQQRQGCDVAPDVGLESASECASQPPSTPMTIAAST